MNLLYDNRQDIMEIKDDLIASIQEAINTVMELEQMNDNYEISLSFVSNEEIKDLNALYRNKDAVTDVLSFPVDWDLDGFSELIPLGDIVISTQRAKEQAEDYGHSIMREILYLIVHSMLHLLGYDHMTVSDQKEMREREKMAMEKLGVFK